MLYGIEQSQAWRHRNTCESAVTLICQEKMHNFFHPSMNLREGIREKEMSYALMSRKKKQKGSMVEEDLQYVD